MLLWLGILSFFSLATMGCVSEAGPQAQYSGRYELERVDNPAGDKIIVPTSIAITQKAEYIGDRYIHSVNIVDRTVPGSDFWERLGNLTHKGTGNFSVFNNNTQNATDGVFLFARELLDRGTYCSAYEYHSLYLNPDETSPSPNMLAQIYTGKNKYNVGLNQFDVKDPPMSDDADDAKDKWDDKVSDQDGIRLVFEYRIYGSANYSDCSPGVKKPPVPKARTIKIVYKSAKLYKDNDIFSNALKGLDISWAAQGYKLVNFFKWAN